MRLNRRNVLIGIGTVAVGSGAALGSGAFTQVSAERTMSVDVAGDANAFLALTANAATGAVTNSGGPSSNELQVDLSTSFASGDGVNDGALTSIGQLDSMTSPSSVTTAGFTITNNGNVPVDVSVANVAGSNPGIMTLPTQVAVGDHNDATTDFSSVADLAANPIDELAAGATADVVVLIDTTGGVGSVSGAVTSVTFEGLTD